MTSFLKVLALIDPGELPKAQPTSATLQTALEVVFGIIGALAFLMIVISGLRYILSAGDPEKAKRAREGIIYALVGLVIAIMAEAIVGLVLNHV